MTADATDRPVTEVVEHRRDIASGEVRPDHSLHEVRKLLVAGFRVFETPLIQVLLSHGIATAFVEFDRLREHPEGLRLRVAEGGDTRLDVLGGDRAVILMNELDALAVVEVACRTRHTRPSRTA